MTRKEIIEILVKDYNVERSTVNKLKLTELEEMLQEYQGSIKEEVSNEIEVVEELKQAEPIVKVTEHKKFQLSIHELKIERFDRQSNVLVKNLGGGDVFVSDVPNKLMDTINTIRPNEAKEFRNVTILYMTSASRPTVELTY